MSTSDINLNICYGCMKKLQEGQHVCPSCGYDNSSRQNQDDLLPEGTVLFRKYLIGKVIGRGGFGVTYLGYDLDLEIKVAIKEYFPIGVCVRTTQSFNVVTASAVADTSAFSKGCEVFLDEARTLAKFNSPYIVHVRDFFREHGTAYIVMDYVEGTTLKAEMRKNGGRLPAESVISLMEPLIAQLDELHEKSIIHRDIKPENLILVKDRKGEHLVLLDFGAARAYVSNETKTMTGVVTQGFSPLEQYSQKSRQGPFTDVYALCATMYNAITGAVPPPAIERNIDDTPLKPISEYGVPIEKRAEAAIMHGMALKSTDRTQTMEQLLEELDAHTVNQDEEEQQEQKETEAAYLRACDLQKNAKTEEDYQKAIQEFKRMEIFPNSKEHIAQCEEEIRRLNREEKRDNTEENRRNLEREGKKQPIQEQNSEKKKSVIPKILAACVAVAVLAAGIWLFSDKPKPEQKTTMASSSEPETLTSTPTPSTTSVTTAIEVGDIIKFGRYEQDNDLNNGKEDIEWQVLDVQDGKALLISEYALDCQQYNTESTDVTWETCSLRNWLNDTFLSKAFTDEERTMIPTGTVSADKNPLYSTDPGNATQDQIFMLNITEAKQYFNTDEARKCVPTAYAIAQGAYTSDSYKVDGKTTCWWWLRSPGHNSYYAASVYGDGSVYDPGDHVDIDIVAVRPALWINLAS